MLDPGRARKGAKTHTSVDRPGDREVYITMVAGISDPLIDTQPLAGLSSAVAISTSKSLGDNRGMILIPGPRASAKVAANVLSSISILPG